MCKQVWALASTDCGQAPKKDNDGFMHGCMQTCCLLEKQEMNPCIDEWNPKKAHSPRTDRRMKDGRMELEETRHNEQNTLLAC